MAEFVKSSAVLSDIESGNKISDYELEKVASRHSSTYSSN
jgi:hypothetical protein